MEMAKVVLKARGIKKSFGNNVVIDGLGIDLVAGTMTSICGPSGCGKSTFLNILGLLEPFDDGSLTICGIEAPKSERATAKLIREHLNYLFQSYALVDDMTVEANLLMAQRYRKVSKRTKQAVASAALEHLGLDGYGEKKVCELSGGEQQRVALARTMVKPGEILLADEPTGSLDTKNRAKVVGVLREMARSGKAVLVVTHDEWVANQSDRVISLK